MNDQPCPKAAVTVAEMARMVGLSRQRFYQLIGTTFPHPVYDIQTRRPSYPAELQSVCLEVRRRSLGIDGRAILFYCRGDRSSPLRGRAARTISSKRDEFGDIASALKALGLPSVTAEQVRQAIQSLCPNGVGATVRGEVIRAVFLCTFGARTPEIMCGDYCDYRPS